MQVLFIENITFFVRYLKNLLLIQKFDVKIVRFLQCDELVIGNISKFM